MDLRTAVKNAIATANTNDTGYVVPEDLLTVKDGAGLSGEPTVTINSQYKHKAAAHGAAVFWGGVIRRLYDGDFIVLAPITGQFNPYQLPFIAFNE